MFNITPVKQRGKMLIHIAVSLIIVTFLKADASESQAACPCLHNVTGSKCFSKVLSCEDGEQAHIVDACFIGEDKIFDTSACYVDYSQNRCPKESSQDCVWSGGKCRPRLTLTDLHTVYNTCDPYPKHCQLQWVRDVGLSFPSDFCVEYLCIPKSDIINPCIDSERVNTKAQIMLHGISKACHSQCVVSPTSAKGKMKLSYSFSKQFEQAADDSIVTYRRTYGNTTDTSLWENLTSSYYRSDFVFPYVKDLIIRFKFSNTKSVRRLWISFDIETNITCRTVSSTTSSETSTSQTTVSTDVAGTWGSHAKVQQSSDTSTQHLHPDATHSDNTWTTTAEENTLTMGETGMDEDVTEFSMTTTHFLIIGLVSGVLGTSLVFTGVVVCILRMKRERLPSQRPLPGLPREAALNRRPPTVSWHFPVDDQIYNPYAEVDDDREPVVDADGYLCPLIKFPSVAVSHPNDYLHPIAPNRTTVDQ